MVLRKEASVLYRADIVDSLAYLWHLPQTELAKKLTIFTEVPNIPISATVHNHSITTPD